MWLFGSTDLRRADRNNHQEHNGRSETRQAFRTVPVVLLKVLTTFATQQNGPAASALWLSGRVVMAHPCTSRPVSVVVMNRGDMPPKEKGVIQPPIDETRRVIETITDDLKDTSNSKAATSTVMRRLNRFEYVNTLRDLLGLHTEFFDPAADFPADAIEHGFDNIGEALTLSDYQLQAILLSLSRR